MPWDMVRFETEQQKGAAMSRRRFRNRFPFEKLEARCLMAGDVHAEVIDGDLIITGDELDNEVGILPGDNPGEYRVIGRASTDVIIVPDLSLLTQINGQGGVTVGGVTGDIRIMLGGGDDKVLVYGGGLGGVAVAHPGMPTLPVPGNLIVADYAGANGVNLMGVEAGGDLIVRTGSGDDVVSLSASTAGRRTVLRTGAGDDRITTWDHGSPMAADSGAGDDVVSVSTGSVGGNVTIRTGAGDDRVRAFDIDIRGDMVLQTGIGDDMVTIQDLLVREHLRIGTGLGADLVRIGHPFDKLPSDLQAPTMPLQQEFGVKARTLTISTAAGEDVVGLAASYECRRACVLLGDGSDSAMIAPDMAPKWGGAGRPPSTLPVRRLYVHGGSGYDEADVHTSQPGVDKKVVVDVESGPNLRY